MNVDFVWSCIFKLIDVCVLVDLGYFVDVVVLSGENMINKYFKEMFDVYNFVGGVDEDCVRGFWLLFCWKCLFF